MRCSLGVLVAAVLSISAASADIAEIIRENQSNTSVIIPVDSHKSDDGYGLLIVPPDELAQTLELKDPSRLENDTFTIVQNEKSDALSTDDFDGRNALYHLMKAKAFYSKLVQASGYVDEALAHQVIVRMHVDRAYNLVLHFAEFPDFNNSRYIPPNYAGKWGREIWFDARKGELVHLNWYDLIVSSGFSFAAKDWLALGINVPAQFLEHFNAGIDAAKMPDVIYHEAFHWATDTDGYFPMASEGNPVAEDYANYFGSSIVGRPQIAEIASYTSRYYKHDYNKIRPVKDTNPSSYNSSSFGPSVFWEIRKELGQERADQLIWNSLHYLNGSFKEIDVPKSIILAARNMPSIQHAEIQRLVALFDKYQRSYLNLDIKAGVNDPQQKPADLAAVAAGLDEETVQNAGLQQAENIRQLPSALRAQGVEVSAEDEAKFNAAADQLAIEARKPGFKNKVISSLKKVGHGFERVGVDALEGLGYLGSAVYSVTAAPLTFGTDFATGLIFGHGMITSNDQKITNQLVGGAAGVGTFYYAYSGLSALGFTLSAPVNFTSLGVVTVDGLICANRNAKGTSSLDEYCRKNGKLMQVITLDTAQAGASAGEGIRHALTKAAHFIARVAREIF